MFNRLFKSFLVCASIFSAHSSSFDDTPEFSNIPEQDLSLARGLYKTRGLYQPRGLYKTQRKALSNSSIYFFVTAYKQEKFAPNLARSLKLNHDRLNKFGVDFQIRLTCDGRIEDQTAFSDAFKKIELSPENYQIKLNEQNKGVSLTRFEQLVNSRDEIMKDISDGKNVYFSLLDGDDIIHQDYCLLMLSSALKLNADVMGVGDGCVRCREIDIQTVEQLQINPIKLLSFSRGGSSEFCMNLFKANCIYNGYFDFEKGFRKHCPKYKSKKFDFVTLEPLICSGLFKNQYSIRLTYSEVHNPFNSSFVSDISFTPLLFYMQHLGSMEHIFISDYFSHISRLLSCENDNETREIMLSLVQFRSFVFGYKENINAKLIKSCEFNTDITEETLLDYFKYNHKIAHILKDEPEISKLEKVQELLLQDPEKPLSREFMQVFYRDVFDVMLGLKPIPHDSSFATNSD